MLDTRLELDRAYAVLTTDHGSEDASDRLYRLWYHQQSGLEHRFPWGASYHAATLQLSRFERGWTITEMVERTAAPRAFRVERGGRDRVVASPDIVPESLLVGPGGETTSAVSYAVGMAVAVHPLACGTADGFWHLHSPLWQHEGPADPRSRLYFSVLPGAELEFVGRFATYAPLDVQWALKVLCGPGPAGRRDSAVAYLPAAVRTDQPWLLALFEALDGLVGGLLPPGTERVADGIARAPELSLTRSFGQVLCDGLVEVSTSTSDLLLDHARWSAAATTHLLELIAQGAD